MGIKTSNKGFTIVELLIVIVVIAILAAISLVAYNGITNRAKDSASLSNASQVGKKITAYSLLNTETLPVDLATAGIANTSDITYQYTPNTTVTPSTFCLTSTSGGISAHIAGTTNSIKNAVIGPCAGHTGTSPTTLADGSSCLTGYIVVPGASLYETDAFCVMKYEAKNVSGVATSVAPGTPWVSISQTSAISTAAAACSGCHLITENEWLTIAQNVMSVGSNWSGGIAGSGSMYRGHSDGIPASILTASTDNDGYSGTGQTSGEQRRTLVLTNSEVIWDFAGNVWDMTQNVLASDQQPGIVGEFTYGYKQYNDPSLIQRAFPTSSYPRYGMPTAVAWIGSSQGIGTLNSWYGETQTTGRVFRNGGAYTDQSNAGIYAKHFGLTPTSGASAVTGFRVAF